MKTIGIPYKLMNDKWNDRPDIEFNIPYDDTRKDELEKFIDFLDLYPNTRINIEFKNEINLQHMKVINKTSENVYVRVKAKDFVIVGDLRKEKCNFFVDSEIPAYNLSMLHTYIALGVTDVYIADDLCYNLQKVRNLCFDNGVRLRTVLNRIPMTTFDRGISPKSPFYRPNDIDYLKMYFDTFEFDCGKPFDWRKFNTLYTTFFIKKDWDGDLSEINLDMRMSLDNRSLTDDFSYYKMNCDRRCDECNICYNMMCMHQKLQGLNIVRRNNKRKQKNAFYMTEERFDRINDRLAAISDKDKAAACREVFDLFELPVVWIAGKGTYQLDPCVILNDESEGKTE